MIGPFDLSKFMQVEFGGKEHEAAIAKILAAAKAANKTAAIFCKALTSFIVSFRADGQVHLAHKPRRGWIRVSTWFPSLPILLLSPIHSKGNWLMPMVFRPGRAGQAINQLISNALLHYILLASNHL